MKKILLIVFLPFLFLKCFAKNQNTKEDTKVVVGAENLSEYLHLLKNKKVGVVVNHTSKINDAHLVDILLEKGIKISSIFAPEHGFRGEASAGETIQNDIDKKTGIPIISLYGKNKKPTASQLKDLDVLVFDIQDVGVRFYTYISTLNYVMQSCAENKKTLIVLDRPNPNAHYVAGPVLDLKFQSFVGVNPIPVVYGLTIGELALMNNGESWLGNKELKCDLKVIKCKNYTHQTQYILPEKPSPNLPNNSSIWLYPSICLFEPTKISVGRGTDLQFQVIGGPDKNLGNFSFTPEDKPGAVNPVNEGIQCFGLDLSQINAFEVPFTLKYFLDFYKNYEKKNDFFTNKNFFNLLIGNDWVIEDIIKGESEENITKKWEAGLEDFKKIRKKYLLYED
jgi:uncharacterized protein YbbC (DUF1343 family)